MDTQLFKAHFQVERKEITFDFKENPQGTFLRITEQVSGRRNSIIIPATGLEQFRDAVSEVVQFNKAGVGTGAVLPLGQPKAKTPAPDDPLDLSRGT